MTEDTKGELKELLKSTLWKGSTTTGVMWLMFLLGFIFGWRIFQ